eukprot:TRINITY_DN552_c0_g1_i13.p4 TRINITY_DN552_c0_g1~~TRINITY_DN552_c0_g1_i13.p4  ORF type:complete len:216 (+),score=49.83 TRINITY_DN552_c0_g1_i13:2382-3029(+)
MQQEWPVIYSAVHMHTKKPALIVDRILMSEADFPESMAGIPARLLCLAGIERLVIVNNATSVVKGLAAGDICSLKDHASYFAANPLTGPNIDAWGTRFPDASKFYKKGHSLSMAKKLEKELGIPKVRALWTPSLKGYHDAAEKKFAREGLAMDVVVDKGVTEAIVVHHMSRDKLKEVVSLGVITRTYKDATGSFNCAWTKLNQLFGTSLSILLNC